MPRTIRVEYPGAIYHVVNQGDRRKDISKSDSGRRLFLETLGQAFEKPVERGWRLGGEEVAGENTLFRPICARPGTTLRDQGQTPRIAISLPVVRLDPGDDREDKPAQGDADNDRNKQEADTDEGQEEGGHPANE